MNRNFSFSRLLRLRAKTRDCASFCYENDFQIFGENLKNRISAIVSAGESRPVLFDANDRIWLVCLGTVHKHKCSQAQ